MASRARRARGLSLPGLPQPEMGWSKLRENTDYSGQRRQTTHGGFLFLKKFPGGPVATTVSFSAASEFNPCPGNCILRAKPKTRSDLINK